MAPLVVVVLVLACAAPGAAAGGPIGAARLAALVGTIAALRRLGFSPRCLLFLVGLLLGFFHFLLLRPFLLRLGLRGVFLLVPFLFLFLLLGRLAPLVRLAPDRLRVRTVRRVGGRACIAGGGRSFQRGRRRGRWLLRLGRVLRLQKRIGAEQVAALHVGGQSVVGQGEQGRLFGEGFDLGAELLVLLGEPLGRRGLLRESCHL
mmetsp:Transcript_22260/g.63681  ORF Transcript_22260/g.63681 Transcript_22260/m.63681 type:complete len:204 (-) Transcript_22260:271-882(-)